MDKFFDIENVKLDIVEPQSLDQNYVASYKVKQAFEIINRPVFCEDVGMYIKKYNDFPGVLTAYIAKAIGLDGVKKLINEGDLAYYKAVIAYKDETTEFVCESILEGKLTIEKMSKNFSPYSPFKSMFMANGHNVPIADLNEEEQSKLSYNSEHFDLFIKKLKELNKI